MGMFVPVGMSLTFMTVSMFVFMGVGMSVFVGMIMFMRSCMGMVAAMIMVITVGMIMGVTVFVIMLMGMVMSFFATVWLGVLMIVTCGSAMRMTFFMVVVFAMTMKFFIVTHIFSSCCSKICYDYSTFFLIKLWFILNYSKLEQLLYLFRKKGRTRLCSAFRHVIVFDSGQNLLHNWIHS
ncbi:MAG: hypothetical protein CVV01_00260 [Firmicutes bacterium HGW-Firmicutes-6]|nr:MAG: hypothetical protein CVV01_00260 [Firmicutes bacterium HGW-Firmicutes-6]